MELKLKLFLYCLSVCSHSLVNGSVLREVEKNMIGSDGRPLTIKAYPAVENYQSDLYEVFQEPFNFNIRQQAAVVVLTSESDEAIKGEIIFLQKHPPGGPIFIRGNITGLSEGKHGLHIQQAGDLREGCEKLGGHFNPFLLHHGGPRSPIRHVGDLGNIEAKENGVAEIVTIDPLISLSGGPKGIVGRALVVTENEDDLGQGGNANSLVDGNAGKPVACGIIAYIR
ncbi:superoxide dismutase [Cu-Zn]-like [Anthonomus grandis grandis]|uniref:superoxide dismutase [Cu-Zn]-like n=1 Tax=Anthonomus grandis grandis TaxID=2921223 RepID=UPI0021669A8B|nr:superoxide dismutase [Cu-Zn]-like [Anthonomus grandis grandis]